MGSVVGVFSSQRAALWLDWSNGTSSDSHRWYRCPDIDAYEPAKQAWSCISRSTSVTARIGSVREATHWRDLLPYSLIYPCLLAFLVCYLKWSAQATSLRALWSLHQKSHHLGAHRNHSSWAKWLTFLSAQTVHHRSRPRLPHGSCFEKNGWNTHLQLEWGYYFSCGHASVYILPKWVPLKR